MSKTKNAVKVFSAVLLLPGCIFLLLLYFGKDLVRAGFWATSIGIGNIMLLFSSPDYKIAEGIRKLRLFHWLFIIAVSLIPIFIIQGSNIIISIIESLCLFLSFIGYSVFQVRIMGMLKK